MDGINIEELATKGQALADAFTALAIDLGLDNDQRLYVAAFLAEKHALASGDSKLLASLGMAILGAAVQGMTPAEMLQSGFMPMPTEEELNEPNKIN